MSYNINEMQAQFQGAVNKAVKEGDGSTLYTLAQVAMRQGFEQEANRIKELATKAREAVAK